MASNLSNLKLKNVVSGNDNSESDHETEKDSGKELDLSLEKLSLGPKKEVVPKKKLLVLNLGGLLVDRVHCRNASAVRCYTPDVVHGNFLVFKRPYCDEFVKFCLERFDVAIWSSAKDHNVDPILDNIMAGLRRKLVFVWDQDKCFESDYPTLENKRKPIFLKQLKKVWENKLISSVGGRYSESNTLLIDDEPHASLLNPPNTAIFPRTYKVRDRSDTFLRRGGEMQKFLEGLADAEDVPTYVKQHSFGQPAITTSHPDWDYYAKIIPDAEAPGNIDFDSDSDGYYDCYSD